jgi:effector-binding domain-containing protein
MGETRELVSRPAAYIEGKANRDEVFGSITSSIDAVRAALDKAGLKAAGRPIAVFLEADDVGFTYRAEIPIEAIPDGKTSLSDTVKFGQTPVGKAMRFEHRGAYEDIDATYEAITAYLDEKGIDAQDVFIEEYLNDIKTPDDPNLQVDIFVLLK